MSKKYLYDSKEIILKDRGLITSNIIQFSDSDMQDIYGTNIHVIDDGKYLHQYNIIIAGYATLTNNMDVIITDEIFKYSPKYVQKFFLLHEIGHQKNKSNEDCNLNMMIEKNRNKRLYGINKYRISENNADEYAAKHIGYEWSYEALSWVLSNVKLSLLSRVEIMRRKNRMRLKCKKLEW